MKTQQPTPKPQIVKDIEKLLNITLYKAEIWPVHPLYCLMAFKEGKPKYQLDENDPTKLIGLNLGLCGLTNAKWEKFCKILGNSISDLQALYLGLNQLESLEFNKQWKNLRLLSLTTNASNVQKYNTDDFAGTFTLESVQFETNLPYLERLDLSYAKLSTLYFPAGFDRLQHLDTSFNEELNTVHFKGPMPILHTWDTRKHSISELELPDGFAKLKFLIAKWGKLEKLVMKGNYPELENIEVHKNELTDISNLNSEKSAGLQGAYCPKLHRLTLQENRITNLDFLANNLELRYLDFSNNKVKDLEPVLPLLRKYEKNPEKLVFTFKDNPLENPDYASVEGKGIEAILSAIQQLLLEGEVRNDRVKLIFIGNSTVGKSSIVRYFGTKEFVEGDEDSTHGISHKVWDIPIMDNNNNIVHESGYPEYDPFRVSVWDFGGQAYYHATHRLFLSRDTVYVYVTEKDLEGYGRTERKTSSTSIDTEVITHFPIEYWLNSVKYYISDEEYEKMINQNKGSEIQILLVQSKFDSLKVEFDKVSLKNKFKIFDFDDTEFRFDINKIKSFKQNESNKGNENYSKELYNRYKLDYNKWCNFEQGLIHTLQSRLTQRNALIPKSYPAIRDFLIEVSKKLSENKLANVIQPLSGDELNSIARSASLHISRSISFRNHLSIDSQIVQEDVLLEIATSVKKQFNPKLTELKKEDEEWRQLLVYLKDTCGTVLPLDRTASFKDFICIDSVWLTDIIYKILPDPKIEDNKSKNIIISKGKIYKKDIIKIVEDEIIDPEKLIEIMVGFDLIFEVKNKDKTQEKEFIAPQFLPEDPDFSNDNIKNYNPNNIEQNLDHYKIINDFHKVLDIEFPEFLPDALIGRFMTKVGDKVFHEHKLWKYGFCYNIDLSQEEKPKIFVHRKISTNGDNSDLTVVSVYLESKYSQPVNVGQKNRILYSFVSIFMDDVCKENKSGLILSIPTNNFKFTYGNLKKAKVDLERTGTWYALDSNNEVFPTTGFEFAIDSKYHEVKVFISYAHADTSLFQTFKTLLNDELELRQQGSKGMSGEFIPHFEIFDDNKIKNSEDWFEVLDSKVTNSDIFISLVSTSFINSVFCNIEELQKFKSIKKDKALDYILFIPVEWANIENSILNAIQCLNIKNMADEKKIKLSCSSLIGNNEILTLQTLISGNNFDDQRKFASLICDKLYRMNREISTMRLNDK